MKYIVMRAETPNYKLQHTKTHAYEVRKRGIGKYGVALCGGVKDRQIDQQELAKRTVETMATPTCKRCATLLECDPEIVELRRKLEGEREEQREKLMDAIGELEINESPCCGVIALVFAPDRYCCDNCGEVFTKAQLA